jgi:dTDP-4-dehydrorhamnose 3,5-epimerase
MLFEPVYVSVPLSPRAGDEVTPGWQMSALEAATRNRNSIRPTMRDREGFLPAGVTVQALASFDDHRGSIVEIDRVSAHPQRSHAQWTYLASGAGVLRGIHLHKEHTDDLTVLDGEVVVGLVDLRPESSTARLRCLFTLTPFQRLFIPPGVAHGFLYTRPTTVVNATSHEYDPVDDFEVRFDDPAVGLRWPIEDPLLSERDRTAPSLRGLLERCTAAGMRVIDELG